MRARRRRLQRSRRKRRKDAILYQSLEREYPTAALPILRSVARRKWFHILAWYPRRDQLNKKES